MDVRHINPFLDSTMSVMTQLGFTEIKRGRLGTSGNKLTSQGVAINIGILGALNGNVVYTLSDDNAKQIASTMMCGYPVESFDSMAQSAISELTNMLAANASILLANSGIVIDITPPTMFLGECSVTMSCEQVIFIEMIVDGMSLNIHLSIDSSTV